MPKIGLKRPLYLRCSDYEPYYIPERFHDTDITPELMDALKESDWNKAIYALQMYDLNVEHLFDYARQFSERVNKYEVVNETVDMPSLRFYMIYIIKHGSAITFYKRKLMDIVPHLSEHQKFFREKGQKLALIAEHEKRITVMLHISGAKFSKLVEKGKSSEPPEDKMDTAGPL